SFRRSLRQSDGHRLADAEFFRLLRPRLDQKHELGALLLAVNYRRREFGAPRNEADLRGQALVAAVAGYAHDVAIFELRQDRLRREEADLQIARRKQGNDRPSGRHALTR